MELSSRTMTSSCLPCSPYSPGYALEIIWVVWSWYCWESCFHISDWWCLLCVITLYGSMRKNPALTTYFLFYIMVKPCSDRQQYCIKKQSLLINFNESIALARCWCRGPQQAMLGGPTKKFQHLPQCNATSSGKALSWQINLRTLIGLTKILKTKQYNITTNSKITPESTPLNTISTEVNIIWKKDLLQGCGRDHYSLFIIHVEYIIMATPNKQQGSVFCP